MAKLFTVKTHEGHINFSIEKVEKLPAKCREATNYKEFWVVRSSNGRECLFLARGYKKATLAKDAKEIVGWYSTGKFHNSYELTLVKMVQRMTSEGWIYA